MRYFFLLLVAHLSLPVMLTAQTLYFPPVVGDTWETLSPDELGWCEEQIDSLYQMLSDNNTKAFIVLKDGKIVLEKYFDTFTKDSVWYWASAGKTLTAMLVGIAQEEGFLDLADPANQYLGEGWTSCSLSEESAITIRHQLTMTSGLNDGVADPYCTLPSCIECLADPGSRWAYHNAPYTLLDGVIEGATGIPLNQFFASQIGAATGISGLFIPVGYNNVLFSKPRSMARYGLLMLNKGNWNGTPILEDTSYFRDMTTPSQALNESYGYLTWLNGQSTYMVPGIQFRFPGLFYPMHRMIFMPRWARMDNLSMLCRSKTSS